MEEKLLNLIKNEYLENAEDEIEYSTKIISSGLTDSFSLVSLNAYIKKNSGRKYLHQYLHSENFDTINQMKSIINQF